MKSILSLLNSALLFLCVSMYFGTGWSLALFFFPTAAHLTVSSYALVFVSPVANATTFLTVMTKVMLVSNLIMIVVEWKTPYRWWPIIVFLALIAATLLTVYGIFPYNNLMNAGITDEVLLHQTLSKWMTLNLVRFSLWTVEWLAMMTYFVLKLKRTEAATLVP
ncbi:MAG TPA: hypothetical protein VNW30_07140 [Opitutaceae bacterium]|jgi:hypothetical protein|nr:hypothetical protein [Opitutaceae bacterium]